MHESQKCSYALEAAFSRWLLELPDDAFIAGKRPGGSFTREDVLPAWKGVWTRKCRYIQRAIERETQREPLCEDTDAFDKFAEALITLDDMRRQMGPEAREELTNEVKAFVLERFRRARAQREG